MLKDNSKLFNWRKLVNKVHIVYIKNESVSSYETGWLDLCFNSFYDYFYYIIRTIYWDYFGEADNHRNGVYENLTIFQYINSIVNENGKEKWTKLESYGAQRLWFKQVWRNQTQQITSQWGLTLLNALDRSIQFVSIC